MKAPETTILYGDAWDLAGTLEPQSIDCICTSPPYWGLRDYGCEGQFGLEPTPQEYVAKLVDLFALLRPALLDCGTVWLNLGDSYAQGGSGGASAKSTLKNDGRPVYGARNQEQRLNEISFVRSLAPGLKPKDLCGIPWRVAFALQDNGWYLRSDIIWSKPNPMPESVTDRPTKAHEYIFLLSKSARYYFDADAVREAALQPTGEAVATGQHKLHDPRGNGASRLTTLGTNQGSNGRNIRTVWTIATQPYPEAHFATFPEAIPELCIKAGTAEHGYCPDCLTAWRLLNGELRMIHKGWPPRCTDCPPAHPATVLDPFAGSGTTLYVARKLGRDSVGFELNEDYRPMIERRLQQGVLV